MKVLKHLKAYALPVLAIVILLLIQSFCDLAMPEYMSNIVNTGIQNGGITSIAPLRITKEDMDKLKLLMYEEDIETAEQFYTESKHNGAEIFVLKEKTDTGELEALESIFLTPLLVAQVTQLQESGELDEENYAAEFSNSLNMQGEQLPEGMTIYDAIALMPRETKTALLDKINSQVEDYSETLGKDNIKQMVIGHVKQLNESAGVDVTKTQSDYILNAGLLMLGYALVVAVCAILVTLLAARVGSGFSQDLRNSVYKKVLSFSNQELNQFSTASLITRCTNDIQQIQIVIIMVLRMVLYAPIIGIGAFTKVLNSGASMSWVILVAVLTITVVAVTLIIFAMPKFTVLQKLIDRINLVSREILTGIPVIRAFSREKHEEKRFDAANTDLMKANLFVNRIMTVMMPAMIFIMNGISILIVWVGAASVDAGQMQVGDIMAFIQYTMQIIMAFLMLTMISVMLPRAIVSGRRISEVLRTDISITDPDDGKIKKFGRNAAGVVEFKHVSFHYPNAKENILNNISFTARPGETTAFIGSTGSGKSTLINLIPRFFDATQGEILVDNINIKDVSLSDLREQIGYVPQQGLLFSGTIESNIGYGANDIPKERIEKAAEIAQAADFIESKAEKYDSHIAQGGTNVSGGQRQRLSIARAIAKDPRIYIFDDSFSALDFKTDVQLRKALKAETGGSTILIVAQRISTVLNADQIVVLDNGEISGIGTHTQLMETCPVYQQIAESQLSQEELSS